MTQHNLPPQLLHDLRSPLNQIIGYSEMLAEDSGEPRRDSDAIDLVRIRDAGHALLALIEENFTVDEGPSEAELPVAREPRQRRGDRRAPAEATAGGGLLLVVDDDAANRDVLSRRLARQGHDVRTASNGSDALRSMRETAFDLVLLDIMMPEMDGYEVLGHIKADGRLQHIPVIMISALNEVQSAVRCIEAGAEDYLAKPFDPTLLRARIGASLDRKRGRDRETDLFDQLQANYERLQEVEKLRDDMRTMIVHDLRTPLTSVIVGVEMLGHYGGLNENQREMMDIATSSGKTLLAMINDLLDVEKMESGTTRLRYTDLSAAALVAGALEQVRSLAEMEQTALVMEVDDDLAFAGDENKLGRTLVNLIANAIKFTHAGTVTVTATQEGESMLFAVRDTGSGIPADALERIFEKFGQFDATTRVGTGLGLTFCKLAVEAHGGRIAVESTPGVGSTFSFNVPLQPPGHDGPVVDPGGVTEISRG